MMLSPSQSLGAAIVLSLCAYAVPVSAQTAQDPGAPVAPQAPRPELPAADVTAEEIRALADGVQGDAASQSRDSGQAQAAGAIGPSTASSSLNPDMSVILDVAAATYTHDPLTTGEHDPGDPGFTLQQLELHIGASVDPFFRLDGNIVYSAHGVELEEAFATTLALPLNFQLRAGQFLTRFGRLNSTHPHQWNFADQPLVLGKFFGSDGNRGVGVEASYLADLPWFAEVVFAAQGLTGDCCSRTYDATDPTPEDPEGAQSSPSVMWTGALKQFFVLSSNTSLLWGLS
ncbi:MAG: zinc-regulated TonB-dependent outer membrane receptor, partial [Deltaproteobacteria bacterium]